MSKKSLRQKATGILESKGTAHKTSQSEADTLKLIHELEVHQIELELQNEELQLAKTAFENASKKYQNLYDFAPHGYFTLDLSGSIVDLNFNAAKTLNQGRAALKDRQFRDYLSYESKATYDQFLNTIFSGFGKADCDVTTQGFRESRRYLHLKGILAQEEQLCYLAVVDMTEARQAKEKINEKSRQYLDLANNGPILIWTTDEKGKVNFFNEPWLQFKGTKLSEELENGWTSSIHEEDRAYCKEVFGNACKNLQSFDLDFRMQDKEGEFRWLHNQGHPTFNPKGDFVGYVNQSFDFSDRKTVENELKIAREEAKVGTALRMALLSNISHEIRTPLNGIMGYTELLKDYLPGATDARDFLDEIEGCSDRLLEMVNNLIQISEIEARSTTTSFSKMNLNQTMRNIEQLFRSELKRKKLIFMLKLGLSNEGSFIDCDAEKLGAILGSLIKNAIKFTPAGSIECGYIQKEDEFEFFVEDTGIGVSEETRELIFEQFRQSSESDSRLYEGAGLGLSVAKSYVEMLGGKIWLESVIGEGSTFRFTVPRETSQVKVSFAGTRA